MKVRFSSLADEVKGAGRSEWEGSAEGALALVIVLDQFPRNLYRDTPDAFASDPLALAAAGRALDAGFDMELTPERRHFFYLPYMHSEALADQDKCVTFY